MSNSIKSDNRYLNIEALGGLALLASAILGFVLKNSIYASFYDNLVQYPIKIGFGNFEFTKPLIFWVNDGLVSIFFLLIGLEIRSILYSKDQSIKNQLTGPCSGAIAGAILPAIIFTLFNHNDPVNMRGWAIPTAMDTAFIMGILALLGNSISRELKMFIMCLAIIDDIIAVAVIAIFYAEDLSNIAIIFSVSIFGLLMLINQAKVKNPIAYIILGFFLWLSVLGSGVHTSIAGVILALTIPFNKESPTKCLSEKMRKALHPWVNFMIIPLFALLNSGFALGDLTWLEILSPLPLGIILGLFIGKQLGIFGIVRYLAKYNVIALPANTSWIKMYGVSVLCGVGFTMSLFIGVLAFESGGPNYDHLVKAGVFAGSLLSGIVGFIILYLCKMKSL